jgi:hypothetical protein
MKPPAASVISLSLISSGIVINANDAAVYWMLRLLGCRNAVRPSKALKV